MTGICSRTLHNMIDHLACSLSDLEGSELARIAEKNGQFDPDGNDYPDGVAFSYSEEEERLNHIRWSERFLTSIINDAFRVLHIERPDLFVGKVRFKLEPGCLEQSLPCECVNFIDLIDDGCTDMGLSRVSASQASSAAALGKYFCLESSSDKGYTTDFSFNPETPNVITLTNAPPFGEDTYLTAYCSLAPPCYDWPDDKDEILGRECNPKLDLYEVFIIEWALHRAFETDIESEASRKLSEYYREHAFHLITEGKTTDYFLHHPDLYLIGPIDKGTGDGILLRQQ